jgi:DNA-binding MarR family transcriptional regulator
MSRIVRSLERAGLVRRQPTGDRRRVRLEATANGTKILQEGRRRRVESLAAALGSLSDRELQQLGKATALLEIVTQRL